MLLRGAARGEEATSPLPGRGRLLRLLLLLLLLAPSPSSRRHRSRRPSDLSPPPPSPCTSSPTLLSTRRLHTPLPEGVSSRLCISSVPWRGLRVSAGDDERRQAWASRSFSPSPESLLVSRIHTTDKCEDAVYALWRIPRVSSLRHRQRVFGVARWRRRPSGVYLRTATREEKDGRGSRTDSGALFPLPLAPSSSSSSSARHP